MEFRMQQASLRTLFQKGLFNGISNLRTNTSGYPFVTLVGKHGANNLYFSIASAETVGKSFAIGESVASVLGDASVCYVENAAGEKRFKLSLKGESEYTQASELEDIFGVGQEEIEFSLKEFQDEFTQLEDTPAAPPAPATTALQPAIANAANPNPAAPKAAAARTAPARRTVVARRK